MLDTAKGLISHVPPISGREERGVFSLSVQVICALGQ